MPLLGKGGRFLHLEEWDFSFEPEFHLLTKFLFGFNPYVWYIEGGKIALIALRALVLLTCFESTWDNEYGFCAYFGFSLDFGFGFSYEMTPHQVDQIHPMKVSLIYSSLLNIFLCLFI